MGERTFARITTAFAALALALAGLYPGNNPDTFGHLAQGRQIVELGKVPSVDTWSLLPGPPRAWHNYEWLSDLGTYLLFDAFGYPAVTFFKCGLLALTVALLAAFARAVAGERAVVLTSIAIISTIPAIRMRLSDRPHVLGICLAAAYVFVLAQVAREESARRRGALAALVVLLHLVWINAHGSHLLGLAITLSFAACCAGARRTLLALVGAELVASCVSPYGPAIVLDAIDHVADSRYRTLVTEWLPWRDTDPPWLQLGPALHGAVLALLLPRILRGDDRARALLPLALVLGVASFRSIRFVAEFMLLTSPLIGAGLSTWLLRAAPRGFALGASSALSMMLGAAYFGARVLPPDLGIGVGLSYATLPRSSAELLRDHGAEPRVLAAMQDAWFTMFVAPKARFAIDGRVPFYGPEHVRRVSYAFSDEAHFSALVAELGVNTVLVSHAAEEDHRLGEFAAARGFTLVFIEDLHALYVRGGALREPPGGSIPALETLEPSYDLAWLFKLEADQRIAIRAELAQLAKYEGTGAYRAWVEGVLAIVDLRRAGPADGFRWPANEREFKAYQRAYPNIVRAAEAVPMIPVVSALEAEIATVLCKFEHADRALERALSQGASREPLLVAQELALRRGERDAVRRVIEQAQAMPEGKRDPWLRELAQGLKTPPRCP